MNRVYALNLMFPSPALEYVPARGQTTSFVDKFLTGTIDYKPFRVVKSKSEKGGPQQTKATPLVDAASRFEPAVVVAVHPVRPGGRLGLAGAESFAPVPSCTVTTTGSTGRVETCKGGTERTHTSISATFESARPKGVPGVLNRHVSPYLQLTPYGHT